MASPHQGLSAGRWQEFALFEQLGNVASEVGRAARWKMQDRVSSEGAFVRALELLDLTMRDKRWHGRLKEISRSRELLASAFLGDDEYKTSLADLERYFSQFALAARLKKKCSANIPFKHCALPVPSV